MYPIAACALQCNTASGDQQCISQQKVCDGWKECDDGEDEENCCEYSVIFHSILLLLLVFQSVINLWHVCAACEYKCEKGVHPDYFGGTDSSRTCIKLKDVCDKEPDCANGQDEVGCNY